MASAFEQAVDQVHETLADPSVWKGLFRNALRENTPLRRIVWIPTDIDTQPPKYINPRQHLNGQIAKVLYRENWSVEAHITAESFEALDVLRLQLLTIMKRLFGTDSVPQGGSFRTQEDEIAGVMWAGAEKCVMRFIWSFNIYEATTPVVVKYVTTTPQLENTVDQSFTIMTPTARVLVVSTRPIQVGGKQIVVNTRTAPP